MLTMILYQIRRRTENLYRSLEGLPVEEIRDTVSLEKGKGTELLCIGFLFLLCSLVFVPKGNISWTKAQSAVSLFLAEWNIASPE